MDVNLALPGNPRYQPKSLQAIFGYDNLAKALVEVEIAALRTLADALIIKKSDIALLTPEVESRLLAITMSQVDKLEREVTKHDVRALVRLMQELIPKPLRRWVHVPLTSYDVIDTARAIQFARSYKEVVRPKAREVMEHFHQQALHHAGTRQIGRTHGQHALPVTVGFWFATILSRTIVNAQQLEGFAAGLVGKISGAVGAFNAQAELGITGRSGVIFEDRVLERLGLRPAPISTQILPPEPLAYYLFSCAMLSATFGQFGRDCRNLMRTEIGELREPFDKEQVGSSTMAHKRNPINFENLEGTWLKTKSEFGKVLDTLVSEHQRDLVGSSLSRDFPTIIVNLVSQLDTLLRRDKAGVPFIDRITVDQEACSANLMRQGDIILAEPFYIALQMYGYEGDAHDAVNHRALPRVGVNARSLYEAIEQVAHLEPELEAAWQNVPKDLRKILRNPSDYIGNAQQKTWEICEKAEDYLKAG